LSLFFLAACAPSDSSEDSAADAAAEAEQDPDTKAYEQCMTLHRRQQELAGQIQRALSENVFIVEDLSATADAVTDLYFTCRNNYVMSGGRRNLP
jgi:thiamine pyrophosphate-dependent acetolactate synthase large subunit-like protein